MFAKLWKDEAGVISLEYLFLSTLVGLGLVVGYGNLEGALVTEYSELGDAVLALNQGWSFNAQSGCTSGKSGSAITDVAGSVGAGSAPITPTTADASICNTPTVPTTP
jgi:Flp pilus assembly pilin Flp